MDPIFDLNDDYIDSILLKENKKMMEMGQADQLRQKTDLLIEYVENRFTHACNDISNLNDNAQEDLMDIEYPMEYPIGFSTNEDEEDCLQSFPDWQTQLNYSIYQNELGLEFMNITDMDLFDIQSHENDIQDEPFLPIFQEESSTLEKITNEQLKIEEKEEKKDRKKIKEEKPVIIKEEFQVTNNVMDKGIKLKIKRIVKREEPNVSIAPPKETCNSKKRKINIQRTNSNKKRKREEPENSVVKQKKQEEVEDCVDIETIPDELPVLEAADVTSLLEQFEASESSNQSSSRDKSIIKNNPASCTGSNPQQLAEVNSQNKSTKFTLQISNCDKDKEDSTKEVIHRLKRKFTVTQTNKNIHNKNSKTVTRFQHNAASKSLINKIVNHDHDYCSFASVLNNQSKIQERRPKTSRRCTSIVKSKQEKQPSSVQEHYYNNLNTAKSTDMRQCKINNESATLLNKKTNQTNDKSIENNQRSCQKNIILKQSNSSSVNIKIANGSNESSTKVPSVYPLKIQSRTAVSILQKDFNNINKSQATQIVPKVQQMVSVLKKPPNSTQPSLLNNKLKENIVTTMNRSKDQVQNIIVQDASQTASPQEETKKPSRKKLNLAEYRNRNGTNSNTGSPIPTTLVYLNHASTTTDPIKNNSDEPVWVEKEFSAILKLQSEIEKEKTKSKSTCDKIIQTYETIFDFPANSTLQQVTTDESREEKKPDKELDKEPRQYRKRKYSSSLSSSKSGSSSGSKSSRSNSRNRYRSRSRSNSRNKYRSRSRSNSRNRYRSSSRSTNTSYERKSRRIRRSSSSVSSSNNSSSSRLRNSSSRSRSHRSRSRSSSRYCYRSSSPYRSNFENGRWSNYRRNNNERNYDRHRRHSPDDYKNRRRSSPYSQRESYYLYRYNKEKQKQVEERRVVYVGGLPDDITKEDLNRRFRIFGPLEDISIHLRKGNNYGFVTFECKMDANNAVEHGNDDKSLPQYDINFGGRRVFCQYNYADLDDITNNSPNNRSSVTDRSFDSLLQEAKVAATLRKKKV